MKKMIALSVVCLFVVALSHVDGATSRLKVRSSPLGNHVHSHEHHVGKVRGASCAGVSRSGGASCAGSARGAVRFGAVRVGAGACACGCGELGCNCGQ